MRHAGVWHPHLEMLNFHSSMSIPPLQTVPVPDRGFKPHAKFTPEEDDLLRSSIHLYGTSNWSLIAEHVGEKTARQCKERWVNYLSPDLNLRPWSPDEDALLLQKHAELGSRWAKIAKFFANRTDGMVKNRFNLLDRKARKQMMTPPNPPLIIAIPMAYFPMSPMPLQQNRMTGTQFHPGKGWAGPV
jgi:hypothetical protein